MKEILLSQNKIAIVSDEDYERLNQYKWSVAWDGYNWYAIRSIRINGKKKTIIMHREIMNAPKGIPCDHKNCNGLDNRRENLRLCTVQQNAFNRKSPDKDNKLGIKGVLFHKRRNKFMSSIRINNKHIHLGYYTVLADADQAYRVAEIKYFGEFAREETKKLYQMVH